MRARTSFARRSLPQGPDSPLPRRAISLPLIEHDSAVSARTCTLHPVAHAPFQRGYSGLYHLAIHPPTASEFARILLRLIRARWQISPTDHLMSKASYLLDPDRITVEITLETRERMDKILVDGPRAALAGTDGALHGAAEPLDVPLALEALDDDDSSFPVPIGTKIGHVHLYVGDLNAAFDFYRSLGFNSALYMPSMQIADTGAGGRFNHRIAMNTWQGQNAPQAPEGTARMRNYTIRFDSRSAPPLCRDQPRPGLDAMGIELRPPVA